MPATAEYVTTTAWEVEGLSLRAAPPTGSYGVCDPTPQLAARNS